LLKVSITLKKKNKKDLAKKNIFWTLEKKLKVFFC